MNEITNDCGDCKHCGVCANPELHSLALVGRTQHCCHVDPFNIGPVGLGARACELFESRFLVKEERDG